jgi:hypothetical protein
MTHSNGEPDSGGDDAVQLLKTEYQMLGSYDTSAASTLAAIGSIGLLALFFVAKEVGAILASAPLWIQAAAPLVPLAYLSVLVYFTALISFRAKQFREVERELNHRVQARHTPERGRDETEKSILSNARIPGTARAHLWISRPRPGEPLGWLLTFGVGLALVIFSTACVGLSVRLVGDHPTLGGWLTILYGLGVVLVLICAIRGNAHTTSLWNSSVGNSADAGIRPLVVARFVLPRLNDLAKLPMVIFTVLFVWGVGTPDRDATLTSVVLAILVFEIVLYQARYSWNDLRGAGQEQIRDDRKSRGRLPDDLRRPEVMLLLGGLILRLALWLAVCLVSDLMPMLTPEDRLVLLQAGAAVLVLGVLYEVGRTSVADLDWDHARRSFVVLSLLTAGGYAARGYFCAVIAGSGAATAAVVAVGVGLFGLAFVQIAWALDALQSVNDRHEVKPEVLIAKPHAWYAATKSGMFEAGRPVLSERLCARSKGCAPREKRAMWPPVSADLTSRRPTLLSVFQLGGVLSCAVVGIVVAHDGPVMLWPDVVVLVGGVLWASAVVVLMQTLRSERQANFLFKATVTLLAVLSVPLMPATVRSVLPVLFVTCGYCMVASQTAAQASAGLWSAYTMMRGTACEMFVGLARFVLGGAADAVMVKSSTFIGRAAAEAPDVGTTSGRRPGSDQLRTETN